MSDMLHVHFLGRVYGAAYRVEVSGLVAVTEACVIVSPRVLRPRTSLRLQDPYSGLERC
jgi:hypothetical protein